MLEDVDGIARRLRTERLAETIISAGGTGTYDINTWASEIQAGSYALMDTAYAKLGLPFVQALERSVDGHLGLQGLGGGRLWPQGPGHGPRQSLRRRMPTCGSARTSTSCSRQRLHRRVGDRIRVLPAHVDPTVAYHQYLFVVDG